MSTIKCLCLKNNVRFLAVGLVIGLGCFGAAYAVRQAKTIEKLNLGKDDFKEGTVISMSSGRHGFSGDYKYEFREGMTATFLNFDYKDVSATWRVFKGLPVEGRLAFLTQLKRDWLVIAQQQGNWETFGYCGAEAIAWHNDAADYLLRKFQNNAVVKFAWLEKVILCALDVNVEFFTI